MSVDFLSGTRGIHAATKGASLPAPLGPPLAFLCSGGQAGCALPACGSRLLLTPLCQLCCRQRLAVAVSSHYQETCL
jgi:hypothetical protein